MLKVNNHLFEGPFEDFSLLQERPGVFLIVCSQHAFFSPIDCGGGVNVQESVMNHERRSGWESHCKNGVVMVGVLYTADRLEVEHEMRASMYFPCGKR